MNENKNVRRSEDRIIYFREGRNARIEYLLPSGAPLIDDMEESRSVRTEIRTEFDWNSATPAGAELIEDRARELVRDGVSVYVVRYQDAYNEDGFVVETKLRLVEEHNAAGKVRVHEYDKVVPTPEHLRGITIDEP